MRGHFLMKHQITTGLFVTLITVLSCSISDARSRGSNNSRGYYAPSSGAGSTMKSSGYVTSSRPFFSLRQAYRDTSLPRSAYGAATLQAAVGTYRTVNRGVPSGARMLEGASGRAINGAKVFGKGLGVGGVIYEIFRPAGYAY